MLPLLLETQDTAVEESPDLSLLIETTLAEEAPTDTFHIPANAKNKADARKFVAFLAQADIQTEWNKML